MKKYFFTVLILYLCANQSYAQRGHNAKYLKPFSCGDYLETRKRDIDANVPVNWVYGYITGYNHHSMHSQVSAPDPSTIAAYLDKYCSNNPLGSIESGAIALITELGGWKPEIKKP